MEKQIKIYKRELLKQLELREKDLMELAYLKKEYENLQKRYNALANSTLGKVTFKYWNFRSKLRKMLK